MPIAQGPKLRAKGPLPKALLPTEFGPATPGWRRSAVASLSEMAQAEGMQCGPAASKQVGFNYTISGTPIAQGPKLRAKGPLPKAPLSTKFRVKTHQGAGSVGKKVLKIRKIWKS